MINAVGREIPEEVLKATGKEPFKGVYAYDNYEYTKAAPTVRTLNDPTRSKLVENIQDALVKCGIKDGMVLSFHHHFREGDYVVNMVMDEIHKMGIKDITICASSLGKAHDPIVPYIEDGTITNIRDENTITLAVGPQDVPVVFARWAIRNVEEITVENDTEVLA